jgi:hypothetical protein
MSQLLLLGNPRRRRRKVHVHARKRRGRRRMSALQLKYFGKRRRHSRVRVRARRRSRTITMSPNPIHRRRRRRGRALARIARRFRRNPINGARIRATTGSITRAITGAATGAAGAIAVDVLMGQASRFLPANMTARYNAQGGMNVPYYGVKIGLALGVGILGAQFLPGRMKAMAAKLAEGSLVVQGYEILRSFVPPSILLGYYNPAVVASQGQLAAMRARKMGAYLPRRTALGRLGASFGAGSANYGLGFDTKEDRVGEGQVF